MGAFAAGVLSPKKRQLEEQVKLSRFGRQCRKHVLASIGIGCTVVVPGVGASAAPVAPFTVGPGASRSIIGEWSITGGAEGPGVFKFIQAGRNTYTDLVIKKRSGAICPSVNDKNRQIVLHETGPGVYKGTWKWFFTSCAFAGLGPTTVTVSKSGSTAKLVTDSPPGLGYSPEYWNLTRLKGS